MKNDNSCDIPIELNLTEHQHADTNVPLRYRLSSVISHGGPAQGGHYISTVRGPEGVFIIDDDRTLRARDRYDHYLSRNPQECQLNAGAAPAPAPRRRKQQKMKNTGKAPALKEWNGDKSSAKYQASVVAYIRIREEHEWL